jgi:hypothetical protein
MKPCPRCGQQIKDAAIKCRYCHLDMSEVGPSGPGVTSTINAFTSNLAAWAPNTSAETHVSPSNKGQAWDPDACQVCQRHPTRRLYLRRNVGMLFSREWHRVDVNLCRTHSAQGALYFLILTLVFGWWGTISFFANWIALAMDVVALLWGLLQRKPQGESLSEDSFRQWYKTGKLLASLGQYVK